MPTPRNSLAGGVVNDIIYAIGGKDSLGNIVFDVVEAYEPATDSWSTKTPMPTPRRKFAAAVVNNRIYLISGVPTVGANETNVVEEYDPATDSWQPRAPIPTARRWAVAGVVDGQIYVIGGQLGPNANPTLLDTVEVYDPQMDLWSPLPPMPFPRSSASVGIVNGRIYVFGGLPDGRVAQEYDPATGFWTTRAAMPTNRRIPATASVVNDRIYVIGGGSAGLLDSVEEYDPLTDVWTPKTPMPTARASLMSGVVNGKIYAIGGQLAQTLESNDVEEYEPAIDDPAGSGVPLGDINGDCLIDFVDVDVFVAVLLGNDVDPGHVANADLDNSGTPNGLDIEAFINTLAP